jgi:OmcA/MtrC family decaheme c-type cytochrome
MRRISLALALIGAVAVTGCTGGNKPAANTDTGTQKGVTNQFYFVNLFSLPVGGVITSADGKINCGATGIAVQTVAGVQQYVATGFFPGANLCGPQFQYLWAETTTLTATGAGGNEFLGWAGSCSGYGPCTVEKGADMTVVAVFGKPGSGHPNFSDPALHGAAVTVGSLACATCHGDQLQGMANAPACSACHGVGTVPPISTVLPFGPFPKTGLVAAITSVTPANSPANTAVTFTLKDSAGADVFVNGADGKNLPMPLTMAIVNFGTDAAGNALPYKDGKPAAVAPFNPATVSPFAAITSMSVTSGTWPSATDYRYPAGALQQAGAICGVNVPTCVCTAAAPCAVTGTVGFGIRIVAPAITATYGACSAAAPCTCATATPCGPALPTTNGPGMLTRDAATGVYTYTFLATPFPPAADARLNNTHTAWLAAYRRENVANYNDGSAYTAANVEFNFNANTGLAVAAKRAIVSDAACAKCHDGFKAPDEAVSGGFHSSARVGAAYCNICHYEGRGTGGFADSATFIHRIHGAGTLTYDVASVAKTTGYKAGNPFLVTAPVACSVAAPCVCTVLQPCSDTTFHGMTVTYPQDPRNCTECHDSSTASKAGQYLTHPTIAACGSCHDTLAATFLPVGGVSILNHPVAGQTQTNATCSTAGCHDAANIAAKHVPIQAPAADSCYTLNNATGCNTNTNAGYITAAGINPAGAAVISYEIQSVGTWLDGATVRPQMVFRMLQNGTPVDFGTYAAGTKDELITGFVGGPSIYWVWSVPQDGKAAPADFNASTSNWLKQCWRAGTNCNLTRNAVTGFYTVQNKAAVVAASATQLTGGIGYSYNMNSSQPLTQTNLAAFPVTLTNVTAGTIAFGGATAQTCGTGLEVPTPIPPCVTTVGGLVVVTDNAWKLADGFTGRRVIVDNNKCNACHSQLGVEPTFHAGQRNDGPSCSWCHTPNRTSSGWSANASTFIHGIHGASKRSVNFNWHAACQFGATWNAVTFQCERAGVGEGPSIWYPEVEYPGFLRDCTQCHVVGAYDFSNAANAADVPNLLPTTAAAGAQVAGMSTSPDVTIGTNYGSAPTFVAGTGAVTAGAATTLVSSPIASVCFACHTTATARNHITGKGGFIYAPRSTVLAAPAENCLGCHGRGKSWAINVAHGVP